MAEFLNNKILTKPSPDSIIQRIAKAKDQPREGLKIVAELVQAVREKPEKENKRRSCKGPALPVQEGLGGYL